MTTINIKENIKIKNNFSTFVELLSYINNSFEVEIQELESQDTILQSKEYKEYNNIISNIS